MESPNKINPGETKNVNREQLVAWLREQTDCKARYNHTLTQLADGGYKIEIVFVYPQST